MIKIKDVSFNYNKDQDSETKALSKIDLTIKKDEFVSIIGLNGSGKSTLSHMLNGLLKPQQGEVLVDGISTADDDNMFAIRQKVGLLFQNPDNQIIATIVEEDIAFGPENIGVERDEIHKRIEDSLKAVGMEAYRRHEPHALSAGQKQKIAIAGVLAMRPEYLVFDEPTSYLDPAGRRNLMLLLKELNTEQGVAIINVTHFPEQLFYGQRVVAMHEGSIVFDGKVAQFFENKEALALTGIETPLWLQLKDRFEIYHEGLEQADSNEKLGDILCSLS
ncbi:hypothetical protein LCGC14_0847890 [marine sediment metagenome]|uniref:ABC transporter domain-containing protein n=1 Tax=marine sediment metagenome TaxID=412755 RepID=A0A0F9PWG8_9ZZZZ|nr:energy-coupling factor transporter ATPase [Actinomycetota bacterium]